jgi:hypothetical protein
LPGFSGHICSYCQPNFPAVSVVTCQDFLALPFLAPEGRDFPAVSVVSGRDFPAVAFLAWVILKKLYGQQANCSGIYSGIFCP